MYEIFLKFIRTLPPEFSHSLTIKLLKLRILSKNKPDDPCLHQHIFGLDFNNPLGLAAGFDKNIEVAETLLNLGFGFIEVGTITPKFQTGNEKPRVFRLYEDQAVINHLGFNNNGSDYAKLKLLNLNLNSLSSGIVGINIGKNKNTKYAIEDFLLCMEKLGPLAHYITINISSPNTPGLRDLQNRGQIEGLVNTIHKRKKEHANLEFKPILLKISPDINEEQMRDIALMSLASGIDGLIIANSTTDRPKSLISRRKNEIGGLSGRPLFLKSTLMLKKMYSLTNGQIPLIGVGGITNGVEFYEKIKSGACLGQLYTALIYQGPQIINLIKQEIITCLKTDGFKNIKEAIGKDV